MLFIYSVHPKWGKNNEFYYIPKNATKLIIGTMPPAWLCNKKAKGDYIDFFYGSCDNYFWNIMRFLDDTKIKKLSDKDLNTYKNIKFDNVDACKKFLDDNNIGIVDIVENCIHNNNSAADNDLLSIKNINLIKILEENKKIKEIFCTSEFAKTLIGVYYAKKIIKNEYDKHYKVSFSEKDTSLNYDLFILYSPTRRIFNRYKNNSEKYLENYYRLID